MKKTKRQIAELLRSKEEARLRVPIFLTDKWLARKRIIAERVTKQQRVAHERAIKRKNDKQ